MIRLFLAAVELAAITAGLAGFLALATQGAAVVLPGSF